MEASVKREIGGEFHLPFSCLFAKQLNHFAKLMPKDAKCFLTSSGRDSLNLIIRILSLTQNDEVLLPSYLCGDMLSPFREEGINFKFYKINEDLSIDIGDLKKKITRETRTLLIIYYFGYPQPIKEIRKLSQEHSLYLVEDVVQSFLSKYDGQPLGSFGDLAFTSYRKFTPVLDGSLLFINNHELEPQLKWRNLSLHHFLYIWLRCLAMGLKTLYLNSYFVPKPLFLSLFTWSEEMLNRYPKPAEISCFSRNMLNKLDFDRLILKRRVNFQYLLDKWHFSSVRPLYRELPEDVCPLGFPVLAENREFVKQELIKRGIYTPVHWNLPTEVDKGEFSNSWNISHHILTIPIDQRYSIDDMNYILRQMQEIA
jgi:dTDP-4-amino-4,6-dideoxygalactose transaminase